MCVILYNTHNFLYHAERTSGGMSDLEDIRQQKREQLQERAGSEASERSKASPTDPIRVESADEFQSVTEKFGVVLVDFYADWCGPCKQMEPMVERVARETDAAVAKVNIDDNRRLAQQYQVRGVPTVVLFVDGEPADRAVGLQSADQLAALVTQHS